MNNNPPPVNQKSLNLGTFAKYIAKTRNPYRLIVQPRMGFSKIETMREGLAAVKKANAYTAGTITLDSFTRQGNYFAADIALKNQQELNGFPIVCFGPQQTKEMIKNIFAEDFPIQVRHGTPLPQKIFETLLAAGLDATEGGPISYCLPYSRVPLEQAIAAWKEACQSLAKGYHNTSCHLESFAGCMLGQLCPPSLLIALTILESLFFKQFGLRSVSLSLAQGINSQQDIAALKVLRKLSNEYLADMDWHIVFYTYMGVFPSTLSGANQLVQESVKIAILTQCERLIIKTPAEAHRIPTIAENIASLEMAHQISQQSDNWHIEENIEIHQKIYKEAEFLITMVLNLHQHLDKAFLLAFKKGYLDIPYCIHKDNHNLARGYIDKEENIQWANYGKIPFPSYLKNKTDSLKIISSKELLHMLYYNKEKHDKQDI